MLFQVSRLVLSLGLPGYDDGSGLSSPGPPPRKQGEQNREHSASVFPIPAATAPCYHRGKCSFVECPHGSRKPSGHSVPGAVFVLKHARDSTPWENRFSGPTLGMSSRREWDPSYLPGKGICILCRTFLPGKGTNAVHPVTISSNEGSNRTVQELPYLFPVAHRSISDLFPRG